MILKRACHHNDHTLFFISWLALRLLLSVVTKALLFSSIFSVIVLWISLRFFYSIYNDALFSGSYPKPAHLILVPETMWNYFFFCNSILVLLWCKLIVFFGVKIWSDHQKTTKYNLAGEEAEASRFMAEERQKLDWQLCFPLMAIIQIIFRVHLSYRIYSQTYLLMLRCVIM